ncbi:MAG: methylmalonyl Co-A mutase-associated GTPase MeaB [Candidatus Rokubacteria bacterium]|nr:methylmalonyl Co-A mutase-associated GTPase MeaB [Candidatus Rokubacteria bacterium]
MDLLDRMLAGDRLALARLITRVENRGPDLAAMMQILQPRLGRAYVLGMTGPPGAGKSSLVDRVTAVLRAEGLPVGVIAVDPSSPFTGGAVLGDRIRMQTHTLDPDVFIRSMATRGNLGGLARATGDVIKLMDAFGFPWVIVETVGVGQTELDIVQQADTTVVALVPESGDAIQTMKAGLLEVADVFVVNKADRAGAHALMAELRFAVHLHHASSASPKDIDWEIPVLATQAVPGTGVPELVVAIKRHRALLEATGALEKRRQGRRRHELRAALGDAFAAEVVARAKVDPELARALEAVAAGTRDVYSAVALILRRCLGAPPTPGDGLDKGGSRTPR